MDARSTQDHPILPQFALALRLCSENARPIKTYGFPFVFFEEVYPKTTQYDPRLTKIALALRLCSENARSIKTYGFRLVLPLLSVDTL